MDDFPTLTTDHYVALVKCGLGFSFACLLTQSPFCHISQSLEGHVCGTLKTRPTEVRTPFLRGTNFYLPDFILGVSSLIYRI